MIDKLKAIENITYDEAREALVNSNWDMLDAIIYLEDKGTIRKPKIRIFSTKDIIEDDKVNKDSGVDKNINKSGFFEKICNLFDVGNNIFLKLTKEGKELIAIPLTAVVVIMMLLIYAIIPLVIIAYLFNIELHFEDTRSNLAGTDGVNNLLNKFYSYMQRFKQKFKKGR